jgi:RNA polymerase sigma factor (TIGR02999 family)
MDSGADGTAGHPAGARDDPGALRDHASVASCRDDSLHAVLYDELRSIAARVLRSERRDHTLQPTALVNEAWLRLADPARAEAGGRERFLAIAANVMRQVLVDHARGRNAQKRLGGRSRVTLSEETLASSPDASSASSSPAPLDALVLDDALTRLAAIDPRRAQIVSWRVFGGLTLDEIAGMLGVSRSTVAGDWSAARAWLGRELGRAGTG